jgi:hypothetical protein
LYLWFISLLKGKIHLKKSGKKQKKKNSEKRKMTKKIQATICFLIDKTRKKKRKKHKKKKGTHIHSSWPTHNWPWPMGERESFFFFLKKRKKKLTGIIMASQIKKWLKATPYEVEVT